MPKAKLELNSRNVITVRYDDVVADWEAWVLLRSDVHHDSPDCNRKLEKKHLDLAKERDAYIFDFGDTFDAMQGKFDPRRNLDDVRPEDKTQNYYGSIVEHAAEDYTPYVENFAMFGFGNHETAVLNKANTCLINSLVTLMNKGAKEEHRVFVGGYGGWVRFMFLISGTRRVSMRMRYHHGNGGNAPVTRGVIGTNRQAVFLPDADIVVNGHNHQAYIVPIARERLNHNARVTKDLCWFVRVPGYKNEWGDGAEGWIVEKNGGPTPNGAVWLHFTYQKQAGVLCSPILDIE